MHWVVVTDDYPPCDGGVATWTAWAADALSSVGTVSVYARARPGFSTTGPWRATPVRARSFTRFGPMALARATLPEARGADGVLCTTWNVARVLSWFVPVEVVAHGSDVVRPRSERHLQRTWRRCRGWAVSRHLVGVLAERGLHARCLPTPVPPGRREPLGDRWVFVARALEVKGGERFVRMVAKAGVRADVVGGGPALARWEDLARRLGARVRFHGRLSRTGVESVLDGAAAVFLLSHGALQEGLGLTLLEARRRGIPVVGTRSGGLPEAVGDGLVLDWTTPAHAALQVERWLVDAPRPVLEDPRSAFLSALGAT